MICQLFIILLARAIDIYIESDTPYILKLSDYFNNALNYTTSQPIQQSLTMNLFEFQQQIVGIYQQSSGLAILYNNNKYYYIAELEPNQNINLPGLNTNIQISQYNCNQFVGIHNQYIISCINVTTNNLTYIYSNGTIISTEFIINSYKSNIFQIQYYQQELVAQQIFVMNDQTLIISLNIENNQENQLNSQIIQGDYIQVLLGEDGTLFLLTQFKLSIQSNNNDTVIQEFNNTSMKGTFELMQIYQIGKSFNITSAYSVVVTTQFNLYSFRFDSQNNSKIISNTIQADQVKYLLLNSVYLVYITDFMLVVYDSNLKLINYMRIYQPYLVQWNNLNVVQLIQQSSQNMYQSSIITIQILESLIYLNSNIPNLFTVQSGSNTIAFTPIVPQNNCPYEVSTLTQLDLTYPNQSSIEINKMFVGPNLTYSLTSNQSSSYLVSYQYSFEVSNQKFIFQKYCNFPESSSTFTFIGQKSDLYFEISNGIDQYQHQSTSQIVDSQCAIINNQLVISLQYLDQIQLLYLTPKLSFIQEQNYTFQNVSIVSNVLVYPATLFIILDTQQLLGYNIKTNNLILNITAVRGIFSNYLLYRGLLFVDQITQLLVFQYYSSTYYTQIHSFPYEWENVTNVDLGLLNDGFYLALQCYQNSSYLNYYSRQMLQQYSLGLTLGYQQINLYGEIFRQPFLSTSTPFHYYLFTTTGQLMVFQQNQLPYNALYISLNISNQISNISSYWNTQYDTILLANYETKSQQWSIFREATVTITPGLTQEEYTYIGVNYIASNSQCQTMINETILYYNSGIQIQLMNNNTNYQMINQEGNLIQLDPAQYFVGAIQNYTVSPNTVLYLNPITNVSQYNIVTQAATQDINGTLYLQNNVSLYSIQQLQLVKIYDFPLTLQYCFGLFIDMSTQFPVSFCQNLSDNTNYFFAFDGINILQSTINFTGLAEIYYKDSILQIIYLKSYNSYNYLSLYFWITNTIQYQYIYITSLPQSETISPIYLEEVDSTCQRFGLSLQDFQLLLSYQCYPPRPNNYTIIQTVNLPKETNNLVPISANPLVQMGDHHQLYMIVSSAFGPILLEIILTNSSIIQEVNQITTFYQQNFDINQNYIWYTVLAYNDLVININNILADTITIDVYANPFNHMNQQIPIVGYSNISTNVTDFAQQLFDGFLILTSTEWNETILFKVQNTLDIMFDIFDNFELNIQAQNPYSQGIIDVTVLYNSNEQKIYWWVYVVLIIIIIFISVMLIWYCNKRKRDREARLAESDAMIEIKQRFSQSM